MLSFSFHSLTKTKLFHSFSLRCFEIRKHLSKYLGKWDFPEGYDSGISIYNPTVHQKVPLKLKRKGIATWYMCGPTVYADSHIGHASCYVKFDIIRRIMESVFNIDVILLMGITDIDDKIIKKSNESKTSIYEISKKYELEFFQDLQIMMVQPPTITARVTENIPLIINFCEKLIDKEYAYVTNEGNVYFVVSKGVSSDVLFEMQDELQVGSDPQKRDQRDFALWKSAKPGEPFWVSPWGKGRPGWHIECSAMASNVFGSQLDIHSGGYDLIFPHHANEKSQSEAFHGCPQWVNYWIHAGLLQIEDDVKMSKSLGNTISIKEFLKENSVNDFRILCLQSLYRNNICFGIETLTGAKGLHKKFHNFINEAEAFINGDLTCSTVDESSVLEKLSKTRENVISSLSDDFNTSQALLHICDLIDYLNKLFQTSAKKGKENENSINVTAFASCTTFIDKTLDILGVKIMCKKRLPNNYVHAVDAINEFRKQIRKFSLKNKAGEFSEIISHSEFIESAFCILDEKLKIIRIDIKKFDGCSKDSSEFAFVPDFSYELMKDLGSILGAVTVFHKQTADFVNNLEKFNIGKDQNTEEDYKRKISKEEKNKLIPILKLCDNLRLSLEKFGVGVKDRGYDSTWFPLVEKST